MAGQQRKCANCRFYSDAGMPGNGWCTHPKRQLSSGVKLLVRAGELACRNSWGGDLFQSRSDDASLPAAADLPGGVDEVTSVTIPQARQAEIEDRVVADRPAPQRPLSDPNDAAHRDQDERARIMARGSRDALAQARQRLSSRRRVAPDDVVAGDNGSEAAVGETDRVVTRQARFSDRFLTPSGSPEMRADPVPREEVDRRAAVPRDRFDTIPEIDPTFGIDNPEVPSADPAPAQAEVEEPRDEVAQTSYEHVLLRARRIRAAKQERVRPIRHADLLIGREQPAAGEEPWLAEAPVPGIYDTAPVAEALVWDAQIDAEPLFAEAATSDTYEDESGADDDDWNDDAEWNDIDRAVDSPAPRRTWLNRIGFGQRSRAMTYDDADVTRHSVARRGWSEDETGDDEPDDELLWDGPAHPRAQREVGLPDAAVEHRRDPDAYEDDLPAWRTASRPPSTPPVRWPDPLPAAREPADEAWSATHARTEDARSEPQQPHRAAMPARARQRGGVELPDLDDALFEVEAERSPRSTRLDPPATSVRPDAAEILRSDSPRDSYFRASHYLQPEEPQPRFVERDIYAPDPASFTAAELPDLDARQIDVRDAVARGDERVARRIETAPGIPRQCRTCRSFRSADGGTRGWCTNEHAFTHRRMVNDDDLACDSSIGCWWLPADDWRLDLDLEVGDSPTPRMDALIARNRPAARRASGE